MLSSCPTCRLNLESVSLDGIDVLACRSCGGTWIRARDIPVMIGGRRNELAEMNILYPGAGSLSTFAGMTAPCPDCSTALIDQAISPEPDLSAQACPSCCGMWLAAETRAILSSRVPPSVAEPIAENNVAESTPPVEPISPIQTESSTESPEDPILIANALYSRSFRYGEMAREPKRKVAVLTCMDSRMRIYEMLGMEAGDLNVIRNAGGIVTEDSLRSLILSHHLLGTREFYIINHTDCGLLNLSDEEFRAKLVRSSGASSAIPATFHPITNLEENVREQIRRLRAHPWIPDSIGIRGFVYDVRTGVLSEVTLK